MALLNVCNSQSTDIAEMCQMDEINIGVMLIATILLVMGLVHMLMSKRRRFRTLFYLHNARSMVHMVLVISHIFEIAESYLATDIEAMESISMSPLQTTYAWISLIFVAVLIAFVRIAEIHDKAVYLYISLACQVSVFIIKIYKIILLQETLDLNDLRPFLISCSIVCLFGLAFIDSYTIYFESASTNGTLKAALETDEKIGYKHSHATFVSKLTFFWLTPLLWRGYKDPLEIDDLGNSHESETCRAQYDRFQYIYRRQASKAPPSLWMCYTKAHWKMFAFGGVLKLVGDLATLVGPISITFIFDYIQRNLNAPSASPSAFVSPGVVDNGNNSFFPIRNMTQANEVNASNALQSTMAVAWPLPPPPASTPMINGNTEIYYPTWTDFVSNGWVMALVVLCASLAQGTLSQSSTHIVNMIGIRLRSSLQSLVYRKTLLISSSCFFSTDEKTDGAHHVGHTNNGAHMYYATDDNCERNCDVGNDNDTIGSNNNRKTSSSVTIDAIETSDDNKRTKDSVAVETDAIAKDTNSTLIDTGTIANLMSEDALNVMSFFWIAHYVWAIPLKIGFVMYLLYRMLGTSAIIGSMVCIIIMIPLQFVIGKKMSNNAELSAVNSDDRLRRVAEFLHGMKVIKLNAWENVFKEKIQMSRDKELLHLDKDSFYWTLMTFLIHVSSVIIAFVTIAVFLCIESNDDETTKFTTSRLFAALALFNQLTVPLFIFPITIPIIISAIVSTRRLEQFLRQPEVRKEFEGIRKIARVMSRSEASLDVFEIDDGDVGQIMTDYPNSPDHLSDVTFNIGFESNTNGDYFNQEPMSNDNNGNNNKSEFTKRRQTGNSSIKLKKNNQLSIRSKMDRNRQGRQKSLTSNEIQPELSNDLVVSVRNAVFSWDSCGLDFGLRIDRLDIPRGKLTVIVGRNGSGKTSLLAAILREMRLISGELVWHKYSTISYVEQTPWLMKATIRDNIIFGEPFRPRRYEKVLLSCCLKQDIDLMPDGDMTEIGTNGLNLSGGQRQRITIARALYSSANVVIMDDPLSSLDNEVSKCIFDNSIRNMLLKHQRTIIMVTQKTYLVHSSDYIISMENNSIRAKGTYRDIETDDVKLIQEWNSIIAKENAQDESISIGKTARERWKLFKNISKIGFQRVGETDNQTVYGGCKRKPSLYGSRHLTYEVPFPIDECHTDDIEIRRRPSRRERRLPFTRSLNRTLLRSNSLNVRAIKKTERKPVARNASTPSTFQYANQNKTENRLTLDGDVTLRHWDFRQFMDRMSFKRTNNNLRRKLSRKRKSIIDNNSMNEMNRCSTRMSVDNTVAAPQVVSTSVCKHNEEVEDDEICPDYNDEISNRLIYDEERKYGEIPTEIYMLYLKSCGPWVIIVFGLSAIAWQAMKIYTDVWLRDWTDVDGVHRFNEVAYYFGIYTLLSIICILFAMISTPAGQYAGSQARRHLHERLLNSIGQKSMYFFQITPFARIVNRFSADMAVIDKKITATIQRLTQFILLCVCSICVNAIVTPWFILFTIPIGAVYYLVQKFYRYSSRELQRIESISSAPILSHFVETIQGVMTIRAYNQESRFMEMLFKRMEANNIVLIMLDSSNRWLGIALDYLGGVILFAAIVTALLAAKIYSNTTSPSLVALAINYTLLVPIYLNWVVKLSSDLESYIGAVERISHYIDDAPNEQLEEKKYDSVPISWPQTGDIKFENVSLRYDGQTENIIANLNLVIPAGQRLGICGRTGSGKSTLALALFRAVEITSGRILIDDVDISGIHTDEIRTRLSIIPQDVMLFSGTIRENLDPCGHYADLDLLNSLESARLKQTIVTLPLGLDTPIVDNGNTIFSCGEKQLFCLARAVLRGTVCLVLDEATSSLDGATEIALLETASKAFHGRTIITIAHRLTTLLNYDRIVVMENGVIVEDGTPQELRTKCGGKFSTMLYSSIQGRNFSLAD